LTEKKTRRRELSAVEAPDSHLARIQTHKPALDAVVRVTNATFSPLAGPQVFFRLPAIASIAATAAAATTTAAATSIAAATATATATTKAPALGTLLRFVHPKRTPIERGSIHRLDRFLRLGWRAHRHETKTARLAGRPVRDDVDIRDLSDARKSFANGLIRGRKRQVTYIQTRSHVSLSSR
jgi:hypothetical protein